MTPSELYLSRCRVNRRLPKPRPGADRPIRAPARARALVARSYGPAVRSALVVLVGQGLVYVHTRNSIQPGTLKGGMLYTQFLETRHGGVQFQVSPLSSPRRTRVGCRGTSEITSSSRPLRRTLPQSGMPNPNRALSPIRVNMRTPVMVISWASWRFLTHPHSEQG